MNIFYAGQTIEAKFQLRRDGIVEFTEGYELKAVLYTNQESDYIDVSSYIKPISKDTWMLCWTPSSTTLQPGRLKLEIIYTRDDKAHQTVTSLGFLKQTRLC